MSAAVCAWAIVSQHIVGSLAPVCCFIVRSQSNLPVRHRVIDTKLRRLSHPSYAQSLYQADEFVAPVGFLIFTSQSNLQVPHPVTDPYIVMTHEAHASHRMCHLTGLLHGRDLRVTLFFKNACGGNKTKYTVTRAFRLCVS